MNAVKCHQCHVNGPWRDGVCIDCILDDDADELAPHPPPPCPTSALPGTAAKIEALTARREAGCSLWHPADAVVDEMTTVPLANIARLRHAPPPRVRRVWMPGREEAA